MADYLFVLRSWIGEVILMQGICGWYLLKHWDKDRQKERGKTTQLLAHFSFILRFLLELQLKHMMPIYISNMCFPSWMLSLSE